VPLWALHGDGRHVSDGAAVDARERLGWTLTIGFGLQHLLAVAGATLLVPVLTGLPPSATLFFSGLGTIAFLIFTRHRLPAYLGSSVAFLAPLQAAQASGLAAQLGGVLVVGIVLTAVGVAVKALGNRVVDALMPPVVAGAVVVLVGLSLAPSAVGLFRDQPGLGALTLLTVLVAVALLPGLGGRMALGLGIVGGWGVATATGQLDPDRVGAIGAAAWVGLPEFATPQITPSVVLAMLPVVIVLAVETMGNVRAVGAVTGSTVDGLTGDALVANGVATTLAGLGGGVGTTVYPQATGALALSRVYSSATYLVAALGAVALSFSPKAGAVLLTAPVGVLGGAALVLYGLVAVHGAKLWLDHRVDLTDPVTLTVAATALVAGIGNLTFSVGDVQVGGLVWGTAAVMLLYPLMRGMRRLVGSRGAVTTMPPADARPAPPRASPSAVPPAAPASASGRVGSRGARPSAPAGSAGS
jgi:uracil-xanthine permease